LAVWEAMFLDYGVSTVGPQVKVVYDKLF